MIRIVAPQINNSTTHTPLSSSITGAVYVFCQNCCKQFQCLDGLRAHLGLTKEKGSFVCAPIFSESGCQHCFAFRKDENEIHRCFVKCVPNEQSNTATQIHLPSSVQNRTQPPSPRVVALDCEMVGVGKDGRKSAVASIAVIDENENVLLKTHVQPNEKVVNMRFGFTGLKFEDLQNAPSHKSVRKALLKILEHEPLLVGHSVHYDLAALGISYPYSKIRDTAMQPLFRKVSGSCHSLRSLTKTFLNYEIQSDGQSHSALADALASLRLYKFLASLTHIQTCLHGLHFDGESRGLSVDILSPNLPEDEKERIRTTPIEFRPLIGTWCFDFLEWKSKKDESRD